MTEQLQVKQIGNQELIFGNDIVIYDAAVTACTTIGYELGNLNGEIANLIKGKDFLFFGVSKALKTH